MDPSLPSLPFFLPLLLFLFISRFPVLFCFVFSTSVLPGSSISKMCLLVYVDFVELPCIEFFPVFGLWLSGVTGYFFVLFVFSLRKSTEVVFLQVHSINSFSQLELILIIWLLLTSPAEINLAPSTPYQPCT